MLTIVLFITGQPDTENRYRPSEKVSVQLEFLLLYFKGLALNVSIPDQGQIVVADTFNICLEQGHKVNLDAL